MKPSGKSWKKRMMMLDERLWCNLLDHIVVNDEERVTVIFRDGMEIVVPLGDLVKSRTRTASRKKTTS